jgi:hypothetical protein
MDLASKFTKGQIYQSLVSSLLFIIYILGLTTALLTGEITINWIMERFIGLTFIGLVLLLIFPVWRQADSLVGKVMKQMGVASFTLLILTWFIYLVQLFNLMQPTGTIEKVVFDLSRRFAFYTFFPLLIVILYGRVEWDEILDLGDPENN